MFYNMFMMKSTLYICEKHLVCRKNIYMVLLVNYLKIIFAITFLK